MWDDPIENRDGTDDEPRSGARPRDEHGRELSNAEVLARLQDMLATVTRRIVEEERKNNNQLGRNP